MFIYGSEGIIKMEGVVGRELQWRKIALQLEAEDKSIDSRTQTNSRLYTWSSYEYTYMCL